MGEMKNSTRTIDMHLRRCIGGKHFEWLIPMIEQNYPAYYKYLKQTLHGGRLTGYNMIVAKDSIFEEYCSIIFGILGRYHEYMNANIPKGVVNNGMLRDSGYVGEVLTDAYVRMINDRGAKVKRLNCIFVEIVPTGLSYQKVSVYKKILDIILKK